MGFSLVGYDNTKGTYEHCRFCKGKGCIACLGEAEKAFRQQQPVIEPVQVAESKGSVDVEIKPIDPKRRCCMPYDRDCITVDNIRIMYCRVCRLVINKKDISVTPPKDVLFVVGEHLK